jgi:hypothetical protein
VGDVGFSTQNGSGVSTGQKIVGVLVGVGVGVAVLVAVGVGVSIVVAVGVGVSVGVGVAVVVAVGVGVTGSLVGVSVTMGAGEGVPDGIQPANKSKAITMTTKDGLTLGWVILNLSANSALCPCPLLLAVGRWALR